MTLLEETRHGRNSLVGSKSWCKRGKDWRRMGSNAHIYTRQTTKMARHGCGSFPSLLPEFLRKRLSQNYQKGGGGKRDRKKEQRQTSR